MAQLVKHATDNGLDVDLVLPDYHGIPKWKALGKFGGEWREIASGVWKPGPNDWAVFTMSFTFRAESLPTELKFEHSGYGRAQIAYAAVEDRASRIVPEKVLAVSGDVRGAENLLVDDLECAEFGTPGFLEKFFAADKATKVSSVTLSLR